MDLSTTKRRRLGGNAWYDVLFDEAHSTVVVERTEAPLTSMVAPVSLLDSFAEMLRGLELARLSLLLDFRRGPFRNDPEFEASRAHERKQLTSIQGRFRRVAYLVRTAVGRLQMTRLMHADHSPEAHIFLDEREAFAFLDAPTPRAVTRPA